MQGKTESKCDWRNAEKRGSKRQGGEKKQIIAKRRKIKNEKCARGKVFRERQREEIQRLGEGKKVFLSVCQGGYCLHTNHMTTEGSWEL